MQIQERIKAKKKKKVDCQVQSKILHDAFSQSKRSEGREKHGVNLSYFIIQFMPNA